MAEMENKKAANFLYEQTDLSVGLRKLLMYLTLGTSNLILRRLEQYYGGSWVGGTLELTQTHLRFEPNLANQLSYQKMMDVSIDLDTIVDVSTRGGFLSGIVDITSAKRIYTFRCSGAKSFAASIRSMTGVRRP